VPAIYEATARADSEPLKSDSADTLNEAFGIVSKKKSKGRESTR
jgi:hypothetical protein